MTTSNIPISPLRQRFIEDMSLRKLAPHTQQGYIRAVKKLALFLGHSPHTATPEDLRYFQLQMVSDGVSTITLNATITALQLFFKVTLDRTGALGLMSYVRVPRKLPAVLSPEEVTRLLNAARPRWQSLMAPVYASVRWRHLKYAISIASG